MRAGLWPAAGPWLLTLALLASPGAATEPPTTLLAALDACLAAVGDDAADDAPLADRCPDAERAIEASPWGPTLVRELTDPLTLVHAQELRHLSGPFAGGGPARWPLASERLDPILAELGVRPRERTPSLWDRFWQAVDDWLPDFPDIAWTTRPGDWIEVLAALRWPLVAIAVLLLLALVWSRRRVWLPRFARAPAVALPDAGLLAARDPAATVRRVFALVSQRLADRGVLPRHAPLTPREVVAGASGRIGQGPATDAELAALAAAAEQAAYADRVPDPVAAGRLEVTGAAILLALGEARSAPRG